MASPFLELDFTAGDLQGCTLNTGSAVYDENGIYLGAGQWLTLEDIASIPLQDFEYEITMQVDTASIGSFADYLTFAHIQNLALDVQLSIYMHKTIKSVYGKRDFLIASGVSGAGHYGPGFDFEADTNFIFTVRKTSYGIFCAMNGRVFSAYVGVVNNDDFDLPITKLIINANETGANDQGGVKVSSVKIQDLSPLAIAWNKAYSYSKISYPSPKTYLATSTGYGVFQMQNAFPATGKYYWEVLFNELGANAATTQLGLSTVATTSGTTLGGATTDEDTRFSPGNGNTYDSGANSVKLNNWDSGAGNLPLSNGESMMFAYDAGTGLFWVGSKGAWFTGADPAAGLLATYDISAWTGAVFFGGQYYYNGCSSTIVTEAASFAYTMPEGFSEMEAIGAAGGGGGGGAIAQILRAGGLSSGIDTTFDKSIRGAFR